MSFGAPLAVADVETSEEWSGRYALRFSIEGDEVEPYWDEVDAKASAGGLPRSVSLRVRSEETYGGALDSLSEGRAIVPAGCVLGFTFGGSEELSSGFVPCKISFTGLPSERERIIAPLELYLFDCHSHWGIGVTNCHQKPGTSCNAPQVCSCGGRRGQTRCHSWTTCACV